MGADSSAWVVTFTPMPTPDLRLICCPYAGGSPELFRSWQDELAEGVQLLALRLPGRGRRIREAPYERWEPLLDDAFAALSPYLSQPHAFYGHSFGGRLLYRLGQLTAACWPGSTRRLFVSGCRSPNVEQRRPYLHQLSEADFRDALREMGGIPEEVLASKSIMASLLPVIRGEIRLAELWGGTGDAAAVTAPITALVGSEDHIDGWASMRDWPRFGGPGSEVLRVAGGHFFPHTNPRAVVDILNARLDAAR